MSLFFQGEDNPSNPIGVLSSSIREMLQIVSVNDDAVPKYYEHLIHNNTTQQHNATQQHNTTQ
jgi:hypothetical protein